MAIIDNTYLYCIIVWLHRKLFEVSKDDEERKRKFEFVKIAFNDQDVQKMKEALCWLQVSTDFTQ